MSISLMAGVTGHGGDGALSYACAGLCDRDLQFAPNRIDFREIDPPVDEPVAVGADAAQVARVVAGGDAFRHLAGRALGRTAGDAINSARPDDRRPMLIPRRRSWRNRDSSRPRNRIGRRSSMAAN